MSSVCKICVIQKNVIVNIIKKERNKLDRYFDVLKMLLNFDEKIDVKLHKLDVKKSKQLIIKENLIIINIRIKLSNNNK